jgi:hypothetical protein
MDHSYFRIPSIENFRSLQLGFNKPFVAFFSLFQWNSSLKFRILPSYILPNGNRSFGIGYVALVKFYMGMSYSFVISGQNYSLTKSRGTRTRKSVQTHVLETLGERPRNTIGNCNLSAISRLEFATLHLAKGALSFDISCKLDDVHGYLKFRKCYTGDEIL